MPPAASPRSLLIAHNAMRETLAVRDAVRALRPAPGAPVDDAKVQLLAESVTSLEITLQELCDSLERDGFPADEPVAPPDADPPPPDPDIFDKLLGKKS